MARRSTKGTVLVVEGEQNLRDNYRRALVNAGYKVIAVCDGTDALHVLETRAAPLAVVVDVALTRPTAYEVTLELRARAKTRHVPIIVVIGPDGTDIQGLPAQCVLRKPVPSARLVDAVDL